MAKQALADLKVLEWGNLVSAPYCAKLLADLGAEVIKIEQPGTGDEARRMGPFAGDIPHAERSGLFAYLNANKRGVTLNLQTAWGRAIFKELVKRADILVENHLPKVVKGLGLKYPVLEALNPRLVMTSITPFGQTGPHKDYKAYEINTFHGGGPGYLGTRTFKEPVMPPVKAGGRQSQFGAALAGAVATLCALHARQALGRGQHVDVSAQEVMAGQLEGFLEYWTYEQRVVGGLGQPIFAPQIPLRCKDGWVYLFCPEEHQFDSLVQVMGNPEWGKQEIFKDRWARARYIDVLEILLNEWSAGYTKEELFHLCQANRVPIGPDYTGEDLLQSAHLNERGFFVEIAHPVIGKAKYPGAPYELSGTPWQVARPAPLLGEHNEEVYCGHLGYSKGDLVKMKEAGVI